MLFINLRHLEAHEIHLQGELSAGRTGFGRERRVDPRRTAAALRFDRRDAARRRAGDRLAAAGAGLPVRPLPETFRHELELPQWACHLPLDGEDKVPVENDCVDLTPFVREDILLDFPQHPLCKPDCAGLKKKPQRQGTQNRRQGKTKPSAWAELNKLKL